MLPSKNRLRKEKDIERVFKKGQSFKESFLVFRYAQNELGFSRFCFVVGKNFSPKANVRNNIKRRTREVVRKNLTQLKQGIDGILMVLPPGKAFLEKKRRFEEIEEIIFRLFKKAGIWGK